MASGRRKGRKIRRLFFFKVLKMPDLRMVYQSSETVNMIHFTKRASQLSNVLQDLNQETMKLDEEINYCQHLGPHAFKRIPFRCGWHSNKRARAHAFKCRWGNSSQVERWCRDIAEWQEAKRLGSLHDTARLKWNHCLKNDLKLTFVLNFCKGGWRYVYAEWNFSFWCTPT